MLFFHDHKGESGCVEAPLQFLLGRYDLKAEGALGGDTLAGSLLGMNGQGREEDGLRQEGQAMRLMGHIILQGDQPMQDAIGRVRVQFAGRRRLHMERLLMQRSERARQKRFLP